MAGRIAYYGGIVKDGLVLDLDAAKRDSYPGSGTTWNDISGYNSNATLTLISGSTFTSTFGGTFALNGTGSFIDMPIQNFATSTSFSVETVMSVPSYNQFASRAHFLSGTGGNSMIIFTATTLNMWNEAGGANNITIPATFTAGSTYHVTVTRNTSNLVSLYTNGILIGSGSRDGQFRWATMGRLGSGTTFCSIINLSTVKIYNRNLSTAEVLQNYNALKGRFGL
jgi:hypothetical protein